MCVGNCVCSRGPHRLADLIKGTLSVAESCGLLSAPSVVSSLHLSCYLVLGIPAEPEAFIAGVFSLAWPLETKASYQCIYCMHYVLFCWRTVQKNEVLHVPRAVLVKCNKL